MKRRTSGIYDAAESFRIEYHYASGLRVVMTSTDDKTKWGTKFIGSEGWIYTESEVLKASDDAILRAKRKDSDVKLYESKNHHRNFIDAVYSRGRTAATAEIAQRAATTCHIGAISAALGRPLKFDPKTERFDGDEQANQMLLRPMRDAWRIA